MNSLIIPRLPGQQPAIESPQPFTAEWLNGLSDLERKSPELREFSLRLQNSASNYSTWLYWRYQSKILSTPPLPRQGTLFFLDCGRGAFAVTAGHVYEQFVEDRHFRQLCGSQIANIVFDPHERLIDWGKINNIDIATFRVTPDEIAATGKKILKSIGPWQAPGNCGEMVFFGGFPGCERDQIGQNEVVFGFYGAMQMISSFTEYQICCQFARDEWVDVRGLGLPPVGYDLGGASGGPMMAPVLEDGIWNWRLVGIISEAISVEGFERITAVRSHFIHEDGHLKL